MQKGKGYGSFEISILIFWENEFENDFAVDQIRDACK